MIKQHSLMVDDTNEFVCISDIINDFTEYNRVLYNPNLLTPIRKEMLQRVTFECFRFTLTDEQLDHLCKFSHTECDKFISEFNRIRNEKNN